VEVVVMVVVEVVVTVVTVAVVVVVRSHSWCSMLMVVEVAMVKHDTTHLADHRQTTNHLYVRTPQATPMPHETYWTCSSQSLCPTLRCPR
jgi:hypothetical protein